jgi:hypothetical protein
MHIIDVGMQHYTHIARFTAVTLRTLTESMKIEIQCAFVYFHVPS